MLGVVGAEAPVEGPAETGSGVWLTDIMPGSLPFGPPVAAFSAFLLANVVRRFSTAPCISPEAQRPRSLLAYEGIDQRQSGGTYFSWNSSSSPTCSSQHMAYPAPWCWPEQTHWASSLEARPAQVGLA